MPFIVKYSQNVIKGYVGLSKRVMEEIGITEGQEITLVLTCSKPFLPPNKFKLKATTKEVAEEEVHVNPSPKWKSLRELDIVEIIV
jgi:antitoxin component of MazEF toxin-antitoxin module